MNITDVFHKFWNRKYNILCLHFTDWIRKLDTENNYPRIKKNNYHMEFKTERHEELIDMLAIWNSTEYVY